MFFGTVKLLYLRICYYGMLIKLVTLWALSMILFLFKTTFRRRLVSASILR
jgi:hypothetical protein